MDVSVYKRMSKLLITEPEAGILRVQINSRENMNALDNTLIDQLSDLFSDIPKEIRVIILTGTLKAFVAGADIKSMSTMSEKEAYVFAVRGMSMMDLVENVEQPVIAAVNGYALGGGCELAMACDIRLASEKAVFGQPEVGLGICAGFGGVLRLPRLVGKGMAAELLYTGRMVKADEALRIGLVNALCSADELEEKAMEMARLIAKQAPFAIRQTKLLLNHQTRVVMESDDAKELSREEGVERYFAQPAEYYNHVAGEYFGACFCTSDQKHGMGAFLSKEKPNFTGN